MATVVNKSKTGTYPVGTGTVVIKRSVNTAIYSTGSWFINPDLSAIEGIRPKFIKISGSAIVPMTTEDERSIRVDEVANTPIKFHASSKIIDGIVEIRNQTKWQLLGGVVSNPAFFITNISAAMGRFVTAYQTEGVGTQIRISEDDGSGDPVIFLRTAPTVLPDTSGSWKQDVHLDTTTQLRATRNRYIIEGRLNGAVSASLGFASITLLEKPIL